MPRQMSFETSVNLLFHFVYSTLFSAAHYSLLILYICLLLASKCHDPWPQTFCKHLNVERSYIYFVYFIVITQTFAEYASLIILSSKFISKLKKKKIEKFFSEIQKKRERIFALGTIVFQTPLIHPISRVSYFLFFDSVFLSPTSTLTYYLLTTEFKLDNEIKLLISDNLMTTFPTLYWSQWTKVTYKKENEM